MIRPLEFFLDLGGNPASFPQDSGTEIRQSDLLSHEELQRHQYVGCVFRILLPIASD